MPSQAGKLSSYLKYRVGSTVKGSRIAFKTQHIEPRTSSIPLLVVRSKITCNALTIKNTLAHQKIKDPSHNEQFKFGAPASDLEYPPRFTCVSRRNVPARLLMS